MVRRLNQVRRREEILHRRVGDQGRGNLESMARARKAETAQADKEAVEIQMAARASLWERVTTLRVRGGYHVE